MKKIVLLASIALGTFMNVQAQSKKDNTTNIYGNNTVKFSPINIYDVGIGIGLNYERLLDKEQKIGIELPFDLIFRPENTNAVTNTNAYMYFSPGFKFYPSGQRKVTYALGANLVLGMGKRSENIPQVSQNGTVYYITNETDNTRLGVLVNNHLNFNIGKHFVIGLNVGIGVLYLNKYSSNINNNYNEGIQPTGQFKFSFGVRF